MPDPAPRRVDQYRQRMLAAPYEICIERARAVTRAWRETEGRHPSRRAAAALARVVDEMTIRIDPDEALVGNRSSKTIGTPLPVERGDINTVLELELDGLLVRERQPYRIDPADRRELEREILPYWRDRSVHALRKAAWARSGRHISFAASPVQLLRRWRGLDLRRTLSLVKAPAVGPRDALRSLIEVSYNNPGMVMNVFDVQGHLVLGVDNVLPVGFGALRDRAAAQRDRCARDGDDDGVAFCDGVMTCCEAMRRLGRRLAAAARAEAGRTADGARRDELRAIAARCERVPWGPPRDFRDALQAMWLIQVGGVLAYGMTGILAVGRPDQYLYPYYRADRDAGALDRDEARELVEELLVKLATNLLLLPAAGKNTGSELGADSMAVTVGGVDREGRDATNELSALFLDAVQGVRGLGNSFSIRVHRDAPPSWLAHTAETLRVTSGPALFSDEAVIAALQRSGCELPDARDYGVIGCVEPTPCGNTFGCTSGNDVSLAGALEMTLLRGVLRIIGKRVGPDTGDPARFTSFEQLIEAYRAQVRFMVETVAAGVNLKDSIYARGFHNPYLSMTLDGCLDTATDMTCGGARYNFSSISARGVGTAVDSLAAIRWAVYEQQRCTMPELLRALDRDFAGQEPLRAALLHRAPKYGCDDDEADDLAREVVSLFCAEVVRQPAARGGTFRPGFFSYGMHVLEGSFLGATPDGRRAGQPISNSLSPTNGVERAGPTGVLNSASKLDTTAAANGYALNLRLLPSLLQTAERRDKFAALVRAFFERGGMEISWNVVDDATLRRAQRDPDAHRDLVVRVSGYAAFFCDLGPAIQEEIIARTVFHRT